MIGAQPDQIAFEPLDPARGVIYTNCQIYREHAVVLTYELHYAGNHLAILNGEKLKYQGSTTSGITDGELRLRKGRNDLLLKFAISPDLDPRFVFFLPGQQVESVKYRYFLR